MFMKAVIGQKMTQEAVRAALSQGADVVVDVLDSEPIPPYVPANRHVYVYFTDKAKVEALVAIGGWSEPSENYCNIGVGIFYTNPIPQKRRDGTMYKDLRSIGVEVDEEI